MFDKETAFSWAGGDPNRRLIWEGYLDTSSILNDASITRKELVLRCDFYLGERDLFGIGFSDNLIFRKQYYVRVLLQKPVQLFRHADERFADPNFVSPAEDAMRKVKGGWEFDVTGTGFDGTFRIEVDTVPEEGEPVPLLG